VRATAPAAALAGAGGTTFKLQAELTTNAKDNAPSGNVTLVEVQKLTYKQVPPFTVAGAPLPTVDPNRDGVAGNTAKIDVVTAPALRATTITGIELLGSALAGKILTPAAKTGRLKLSAKDDKTGTELVDNKLVINPVPVKVAGFPKQVKPAVAGVYGALNTVQFKMSHGAPDARPVAEMITAGPRNDFGIIPNLKFHVAPTVAFSAPANGWNDRNYTQIAHPKIDVNLYVGPGVPPLPRIMIFKQTFHWQSWTGTGGAFPAGFSKQIDAGIHQRSLLQAGKQFFFRTEQIFPGGKAFRQEKYKGPPLIELQNVQAKPLVPPLPPATAIAADGVATGSATVKLKVPGVPVPGGVNWTIKGGGSVAFVGAVAGVAVGAAVTAKATLVPGATQVRVASAKYPNRFADGQIDTVPVVLQGLVAPANVGKGTATATAHIVAQPGGRTITFGIDAAALAAGVTFAKGPVVGLKSQATITRPLGWSGQVTVTATDSILAALTKNAKITFK
jgi:hypothetical protein